jgi:hypothetical protein
MSLQLRSVAPTPWKQDRKVWIAVVVGTVISVVFGVIAAKLAGGGLSALHPINPPSWPGGIVLFPVLLLLPVLWRWPRGSLLALLAGTTVIDQFQYTIGPTTIGGKSYPGLINVPLFRSLSKGSFVTPAEIVMFLLLAIWMMKGALNHSWDVPRSALSKSIMAMYALALILGVGLGFLYHGQIKVSLWELRPWYYLVVVYLLTASFFKGRDLFRPLVWTLVVGSGLKSIEGCVNYFTVARRLTPRPEAILSHEESFFFGLFLIATAALWLFQIRAGRLRTVATVLTPLVLIADLGNARRTASLLLYAGMATLLIIAYVSMPERRHVLRKLDAVIAVVAVLYLGAFWNSGGTLGQPARAVHSAVAPDPRDLSSNEYRLVENANLIQGIHSKRSLGKGFGTPINYGYASIVNLTSVDSMIAYIPHNGVLYVWYRLGILGELTLWSIVGFGIVAGSKLSKMRDREMAALGAIAVCAIVCWVLQGFNDLGFTWLRIAIFMGFLLGALEVTCRRAGPSLTADKVTVDRASEISADPVGIEPHETADEQRRYSVNVRRKEG